MISASIVDHLLKLEEVNEEYRKDKVRRVKLSECKTERLRKKCEDKGQRIMDLERLNNIDIKYLPSTD